MKLSKAIRFLAVLLVTALFLTSCTLFQRTKLPAKNDTTPPKHPETNGGSETGDDEPTEVEPTPLELLADLDAYAFGSTTLTLAFSQDCTLFAEGTDSRSVAATVFDAIKQKYGGSVIATAYAPNQLFLGVSDMVNKGSATRYFADMLVLSATEYQRYREAGLLARLETIPFLDMKADCFDSAFDALLADESGTYGVVGDGSHAFKQQITLFFNPELLLDAGIDFDGYGMVKDKTWDLAALCELMRDYSEKTGKTAIVSGLSEEMTATLLETMQGEDMEIGDCGADGRLAFMMGQVPLMIGVLGDVEKMPTARDRYGMLPIPYLENGKYETFYDMENLYVFCVPKGNNRSDCTGLFLQAYHTASAYLPYCYFQSQWIEKYVHDEGTLRSILIVGKEAKPLADLKK